MLSAILSMGKWALWQRILQLELTIAFLPKQFCYLSKLIDLLPFNLKRFESLWLCKKHAFVLHINDRLLCKKNLMSNPSKETAAKIIFLKLKKKRKYFILYLCFRALYLRMIHFSCPLWHGWETNWNPEISNKCPHLVGAKKD